METNFKLTKDYDKEIPQILLILFVEKDVFPFLSMGHFSTFVCSILSSFMLMFSTWWLHLRYFPSFKHNVMWIRVKVRVTVTDYFFCKLSLNIYPFNLFMLLQLRLQFRYFLFLLFQVPL